MALLPLVKRLGWPSTFDLREVRSAILYVARAGCQWRMVPKEFRPRSTIQRYFYAWRPDQTLQALDHHILIAAHEAAGGEADTSTGVAGCQSVCARRGLPKITRSGGIQGFDAGKKVNGRKRQVITDTGGLLVGAIAHSADLQDRDAAPAPPTSI